MELLIKILVGFIAFFHLYFLYFEMFAWTTKGRKIFRKYPDRPEMAICKGDTIGPSLVTPQVQSSMVHGSEAVD